MEGAWLLLTEPMFEFSRSVRRQVEFDGRKLVSVEGGGCSKRSNFHVAACFLISLSFFRVFPRVPLQPAKSKLFAGGLCLARSLASEPPALNHTTHWFAVYLAGCSLPQLRQFATKYRVALVPGLLSLSRASITFVFPGPKLKLAKYVSLAFNMASLPFAVSGCWKMKLVSLFLPK